MSRLHAEYLDLCDQLQLEREAKVERALKTAEVTGCLSLQGDVTLSATTCQALANIIAGADSLVKVDLSNCMIPAAGFGDLMNSLKKNRTVRELDLSSNNLQAASAVHLGTFLRFTKTLTRLFLQWNSLGQSTDAFGVLCEGVGANQSLQELDLRNNGLGETSIDDIIFAIKASNSLKTLDLRWNQLGPGGGRGLLHAVKDASQLTSIQLEGNLFSADLILGIEMAATHNGDIIQLAQEWETRCSLLTKQSVQLMEKDEKRATGVRRLLQQQGQKINTINKEQFNEMIRVEEQLKSSKRRMETMESLILDKEQQIETLQEMTKSLHEEKDMESTELGEQLSLVRNQLASAQNVISQYKTKLRESESENETLKEENSHLKDNMLLHNSKCEDVIKAAEDRALSAIQKMRNEKAQTDEKVKGTQKKYEDKLKAMESVKADLEKQLQVQQQAHIQALNELRQKLNAQESEKLLVAKKEFDELKANLDSTKSKLNPLRKELQEKKDEIAKLQISEAELKQAFGREQERNSTLQEKLANASRRQEEVDGLKAQIAQVQAELVSLREEKDSHIRQLTELLSNKEKHISDLRTEESERTGILCSAVSKYISKIGAQDRG